MAAGLRIFDAEGNLDVDITTRLTKQLGIISTGVSDGSFNMNNPSLPNSSYWFICLDAFSPSAFNRPPEVNISGSSIIWTFHGVASGERRSIQVMYGVR